MDYSYQIQAANALFQNILNKDYIAAVLAACPSSGKTTISHMVINKYLKMFPKANVVVLTEGQVTLKNQYLQELISPNISIDFTFGEFGSGAQVQVGIPQSIHNLQITNIDLLVVDECHRYYLEKTDQKIIKKYNVKHQLIMTGSPTKFNLHNQTYKKKYSMYYIAAEELQKYGVFSGVDVDVAKITCKKNATQTIHEVLKHATRKGYDLSKIMVACPTINYAHAVSQELSVLGYNVSASTSDKDKDSLEIQKFKNGDTNALVIVGRGKLGFNDKKLTFLADLRSSSDLDTSYQLFARVLRTHPKDIRKAYCRIAELDNFNKQAFTLHQMIALMKRKIFMGFNGRNLKIDLGF